MKGRLNEIISVVCAIAIVAASTGACVKTVSDEVDKKQVQANAEVTKVELQTSINSEYIISASAHNEVQDVQVEEYFGVLRKSGLTAEEMETGLLKDLKQYAHLFIKAEEETGINAVFIASVASLESGWATSNVAKNKNNLFGWTLGSGKYRAFGSVEECIQFVSTKLKENYLTEVGKYFNGYEIEDVNKFYNGSEHWGITVRQIYEQINARIEKERGA